MGRTDISTAEGPLRFSGAGLLRQAGVQVQIIRGSNARTNSELAGPVDELVPGPPAQLTDAAAAYEAEWHPELTYVTRLLT